MRKIVLSVCLLLCACLFAHAKVNKEFVIVIQAGHGGTDNGAKAADGSLEKDLTLAYAKQLEQIAKENNFRVIMCREGDENFDLSQGADLAKINKADLYISLHFSVNEGNKYQSGFECFVGTQTNQMENKVLGKFIGAELYTVNNMKFNGVNTHVIANLNTIPSPVALINLGYMDNEKDFTVIKSDENKKEICQKIFNAIMRYKTHIENN